MYEDQIVNSVDPTERFTHREFSRYVTVKSVILVNQTNGKLEISAYQINRVGAG